jgi:hypothetical protein
MATKKRAKRFDEGGMSEEDLASNPNRGIVDQTEEEAANEAEMMSSMMRKRAMDEGDRDEKALPAGYKVEAEAPAKSAPVMRKPKPTNYGNEGRSSKAAAYSNEGRGSIPKKSAEETRDERVRNAYRGATGDIKSAIKSAVTSATTKSDAPQRIMPKGMASPRDVNAKMSKGFESGKSSMSLPSASKREVPEMLRDAARNARGMGADKPKFRASQGYASGGSVSASSRADGIATKGKTRGKIC